METTLFLPRFAPQQQAVIFVRWLILLAALVAGTTLRAQPDYANAHWNPPDCVKWYTSGNGHDFCVIHDMEGYYEASIALLNTCGANEDEASVYYLVEGLTDQSDPAPAGDITQSVSEQYYAWHVLCWNTWMFGTEHEGFVSNPAWYTPQQYQASAGIQRHLCIKYGIPMDRNHIVGHNEWENPVWTNWMATNYPQINTACNNHTDPGVYWNWTYFMDLISGSNGMSGTFWDATNSSGVVTSGTWDNFTTNWNPRADGTAARGTWVGDNVAVFCAGSRFVSAYTVTLTQTQCLTGLIISNGSPTFTGGGLAFEGTNAYYSNYVGPGLLAVFNTTFTGTGAPDKWGAGTAFYNTAAAVTGSAYFTLNQGTIAIENSLALGSNKFVIGDSTGSNIVTFEAGNSTAYTLSNYIVVNATNFIVGLGGNLTFTGPINLGTGARTMNVSNFTTISGAITNSASLTKAGGGPLVLNGNTTNTYGATYVNAGTLILSKSNTNCAIPAAGITISNGGILQSAASDQISDLASMNLSGGTWQTGGFNETLFVLKVASNSIINMGSSGVIKFGNSSAIPWGGTSVLSIQGWQGRANGAGTSQLYFGATSAGLTTQQLSQIQFVNPLGLSGNFSAKILSTGEVVPGFVLPTFGAQPQSQAALVGNNVTFTASGNGTSPLSYQWKAGSSNILGATGTSLTLTNISLGAAGSYSVVLTNVAGTNTSNPAQLTVYSTAAATLGAPLPPFGGRVSFGVAGVPGYNYVIQSSSNLLKWISLETNISPFTFTDTNAVNAAEFYRALYFP